MHSAHSINDGTTLKAKGRSWQCAPPALSTTHVEVDQQWPRLSDARKLIQAAYKKWG